MGLTPRSTGKIHLPNSVTEALDLVQITAVLRSRSGPRPFRGAVSHRPCVLLFMTDTESVAWFLRAAGAAISEENKRKAQENKETKSKKRRKSSARMKRLIWREFVNRKSDKNSSAISVSLRRGSVGYQSTKSSNLCHRTDRTPYSSISSLQ